MNDLIVIFLLWFGAFFLLVAAVGLVRLKDVFMRMHAMTKAGTLGIAGLTLGVAIHYNDTAVTLQTALIIGFFLITNPIAAHMIGRAAYHRGAINSDDLVCDQYRDTLAAKPDTGEGVETAQASDAPSDSA